MTRQHLIAAVFALVLLALVAGSGPTRWHAVSVQPNPHLPRSNQ